MLNIKNIFTTAVIATATLCVADVVTPQKAQAAGCYPPLASSTMANMVRGGATARQGLEAAIRKGEIDGKACYIETLGYMRSLPYVFGDVL